MGIECVALQLVASWQLPHASEIGQPHGRKGELRVAVLIGESVEEYEEMKVSSIIPCVLRRLQFLEDCDRARLHFTGTGVPPLASLRSVPILSSITGLPDTNPSDSSSLRPVRITEEL
jgi:hypothetical protein